MNSESEASPELLKSLGPIMELREFDDFFDFEELHSKVVDELIRRDILDENLLLTGYDASSKDTDRKSTFAVTLDVTQKHIANQSDGANIPYDYAFAAVEEGGIGEVAFYDPEKFIETSTEKYRLKPGYTFDDATLLKLRLLPQS